jgi:DNA-binding transcriptional LysR family regulator
MLRDLETAESLPALAADEVDLAVVDEYDEATRIREPGIEVLDLLTEPLLLALPPGHAVGEGEVRLSSLRDDAWIMDTEDSGICRALVRACRGAGFEPHVRSNCRDYSVIIALVEAGLGVALLPGLALRDRAIRARVAPVDPALERRVRIAVKPERRSHPAVAAMLGELQRVAATPFVQEY